jgi:hypothetical protein
VEKAYSEECAKGTQAGWVGREAAACWEGQAGAGGAGPAGLNSWGRFKLKKNDF